MYRLSFAICCQSLISIVAAATRDGISRVTEAGGLGNTCVFISKEWASTFRSKALVGNDEKLNCEVVGGSTWFRSEGNENPLSFEKSMEIPQV
ncbi:MAG: hypothetical protein R2765_10850 [Ferruginibacter sp.]